MPAGRRRLLAGGVRGLMNCSVSRACTSSMWPPARTAACCSRSSPTTSSLAVLTAGWSRSATAAESSCCTTLRASHGRCGCDGASGSGGVRTGVCSSDLDRGPALRHAPRQAHRQGDVVGGRRVAARRHHRVRDRPASRRRGTPASRQSRPTRRPGSPSPTGSRASRPSAWTSTSGGPRRSPAPTRP